LLVTPVFSFFLLVYLIVHQIGLVGCDKLGTTTKAVSIVVGIFLMIAWIPGFTLGFYSLAAYEACTMTPQTDAAQELCIQNRINAFAPISAWTVFCIWGTWVAFRHFSIKDSYEPEGERSRVRRLKEMSVDIEVRPGLRGDPSAQPGHITTAFELYTFLKGKMRHIRAASIIAFILCGGTVGIVRGAVVRTDQTVQGLSDSAVVYQQVNFILSTVFFTGMFMVFYATFAFIIVSYLHQVNFVRELTYSMDDQKRSRRIRINAEDIKQLRAWEECRRLAVEELTSSNSILNAMFTPSMWLCALGSILMSGYLVYSKLFQTGNNISSSFSTFSAAVVVLLVLSVGFMACAIVVAQIAQKHFKRHTALVAQKTFDIARKIDEYYTNEGDDDLGAVGNVQSWGGGGPTSFYANDPPSPVGGYGTTSLRIEVPNRRESNVSQGSSTKVTGNEISIAEMEQVFASLHSLSAFLTATQPRPLILGIELRHVRFVVVFVLLVSGIVLFVSLMVAFKNQHCGRLRG
jgi:hypothetical protein